VWNGLCLEIDREKAEQKRSYLVQKAGLCHEQETKQHEREASAGSMKNSVPAAGGGELACGRRSCFRLVGRKLGRGNRVSPN